MNKKKCKNCIWMKVFAGKYICGFIAEYFQKCFEIVPESPCKHSDFFKKYSAIKKGIKRP